MRQLSTPESKPLSISSDSRWQKPSALRKHSLQGTAPRTRRGWAAQFLPGAFWHGQSDQGQYMSSLTLGSRDQWSLKPSN